MLRIRTFDFIAARSYANKSVNRTEIVDGITYKILVTPESSDEFKKYLAGIKITTVTDDHARIYCSDSKYMVRCIAIDPVTAEWLYHDYEAKSDKPNFL